MSASLLDQQVTDGHHDEEAVQQVLDAARRLHASECTGCTCVESVTVQTIETAYYVDDVAGAPVGVTLARAPMVLVEFSTPDP